MRVREAQSGRLLTDPRAFLDSSTPVGPDGSVGSVLDAQPRGQRLIGPRREICFEISATPPTL